MPAFRVTYTSTSGLEIGVKKLHPQAVIITAEDNDPIVSATLTQGVLELNSQKEIDIFLIRDQKVGKILSSATAKKGAAKVGDVIVIAEKNAATSHKELLDFISSLVTSETAKLDPLAVISIEEEIIATPQKDVLEEKVTVIGSQKSRFDLRSLKRIIPNKSDIKPKLRNLLLLAKRKIIWTDPIVAEDPKKIRNKKILFAVSVILTILLCISLFITIRETRNKKREKVLNEALTLISPEYEEAVNLIDLNPVRARELLGSAKLSLSPLLKDFPKDSVEYKKANEWLAKVDSAQMQAYKIYSLTDVPLFFDVSFIKANGEIDKLSVFEGTMALLDTKNQAVYSLTLNSKQAKILAGFETVKDGKSIALYGENAYILNSDGIVKISLASGKGSQVISKDESWEAANDIAMYGGNLYVLDPGKPQIWKYTASENGFNSIQPYLTGTNVDFETAHGINIDGSIWVAVNQGIYKFTRGISDEFKIKGSADTIPSFNDISAVEDNQKLYVLDKTLSRIVVFDKEGVYQSQYQWSELKTATTLFASEQNKKVYVAIGSKLYAIDLK